MANFLTEAGFNSDDYEYGPDGKIKRKERLPNPEPSAVDRIANTGTAAGKIVAETFKTPGNAVKDVLGYMGNRANDAMGLVTGFQFPGRFNETSLTDSGNAMMKAGRDLMGSFGAKPVSRITGAPESPGPASMPVLQPGITGTGTNAVMVTLSPEERARKALNESTPFVPQSTDDIARLFAANNPTVPVTYNGSALNSPLNPDAAKARGILNSGRYLDTMEGIPLDDLVERDPRIIAGLKRRYGITGLSSPPIGPDAPMNPDAAKARGILDNTQIANPTTNALNEDLTAITSLVRRMIESGSVTSQPERFKAAINALEGIHKATYGAGENAGKYGTTPSHFGSEVEGKKVQSAAELARQALNNQGLITKQELINRGAKALKRLDLENKNVILQPGAELITKEPAAWARAAINEGQTKEERTANLKMQHDADMLQLKDLELKSKDPLNSNRDKDWAAYNELNNRIQSRIQKSRITRDQFIAASKNKYPNATPEQIRAFGEYYDKNYRR